MERKGFFLWNTRSSNTDSLGQPSTKTIRESLIYYHIADKLSPQYVSGINCGRVSEHFSFRIQTWFILPWLNIFMNRTDTLLMVSVAPCTFHTLMKISCSCFCYFKLWSLMVNPHGNGNDKLAIVFMLHTVLVVVCQIRYKLDCSKDNIRFYFQWSAVVRDKSGFGMGGWHFFPTWHKVNRRLLGE